MGSFFSSPRKVGVMIGGIDFVGKTTILYQLKLGKNVETTPTIGFNVEQFEIEGFEFTAWDTPGRCGLRHMSRYVAKGIDALIFVVDSDDKDRLPEALDEMKRLRTELPRIPMLVYCNKQDLPGAMKPQEIEDMIGTAEDVFVVGCVATTGKGLKEGIELLAKAVAEGSEITNETEECKDIPSSAHELDFDPITDNETLQHFSIIKNKTQCPFAKSAMLWGGKSNPPNTSIEAQARSNLTALIEFTRRSKQGESLDGFCLEVNDSHAHADLAAFGQCVRRYLTALADGDPSGENMMRVSYIGQRGWRFRFNRSDFFVTTFAPCYPVTSSRYAFGCGRAFILLQPEVSFLRLTPDTPDTNWENPQTMRDKTRVAFQQAGRPYHIPSTTHYPMALHVVKPLEDDGVNVFAWWETPDAEPASVSTMSHDSDSD